MKESTQERPPNSLSEIGSSLEEASNVYLYDTAAISKQELSFHRHGLNILGQVIPPNSAIVLTETIANEMRISGDGTRYAKYLGEFQKVITIREEDFLSLLNRDFNKHKAFAKYKECTAKAFSTIQDLTEKIMQSYTEAEILDAINRTFAAHQNKNKGEYSLVWLSYILRTLYKGMHIHFVGEDRDLFVLVDKRYLALPLAEKLKVQGQIQIISTDTILQAILREKGSHEAVRDICQKSRIDPSRKVLFHKLSLGIKQGYPVDGAITNDEFIECVSANQIEIIY